MSEQNNQLHMSTMICDSISDGESSFDIEELYKKIIIDGDSDDDASENEDNENNTEFDYKVANIDLNYTPEGQVQVINTMTLVSIEEDTNIDDIFKFEEEDHGYALLLSMIPNETTYDLYFYRINPKNTHNITLKQGTRVGYIKHTGETEDKDTINMSEITYTFRNKSDDIIMMITLKNVEVDDETETANCTFGSEYFKL